MDVPIPRNIHHLKRFLGLVNSFRDFIPNFAQIEKPLNKLSSSKKNFCFNWNYIHDESFNKLKEGVRNCTQLHHLTCDCPIVLEVDASQVGVGAYLAQINDNRKTPVVFLSHVFSYQAHLRYLLGYPKLESYLPGTHFCRSTDHKKFVFMD
jgi:hypothetical protein